MLSARVALKCTAAKSVSVLRPDTHLVHSCTSWGSCSASVLLRLLDSSWHACCLWESAATIVHSVSWLWVETGRTNSLGPVVCVYLCCGLLVGLLTVRHLFQDLQVVYMHTEFLLLLLTDRCWR